MVRRCDGVGVVVQVGAKGKVGPGSNLRGDCIPGGGDRQTGTREHRLQCVADGFDGDPLVSRKGPEVGSGLVYSSAEQA